jgi:hypothetical protein
MKSSGKLTAPSQPEPGDNPSLGERCSRLVEAIDRWRTGIATGEIEIPGTLPSCIIHKTATSLEEIMAACVGALLSEMGETDRARMKSVKGGGAGFGESVRTFKGLTPVLAKKFPGMSRDDSIRAMNLLDKLVRMRNDLMHRTLLREDKQTVVNFIRYAKEFCESEFMRLAIQCEH